jgi:uncharacterized protein (DUF427 family)
LFATTARAYIEDVFATTAPSNRAQQRGQAGQMSQDMKDPGPDHPISIATNPRRVRVTFNGRVVADTHSALTLREANLPAVEYIPRADVDMALLERTAHATYCPYKGDASYFSLKADGRGSENAVWSYEAPYPAVAAIKGHLAFYPDRVDLLEETESGPRP